jgi:hypothetical protein
MKPPSVDEKPLRLGTPGRGSLRPTNHIVRRPRSVRRLMLAVNVTREMLYSEPTWNVLDALIIGVRIEDILVCSRNVCIGDTSIINH